MATRRKPIFHRDMSDFVSTFGLNRWKEEVWKQELAIRNTYSHPAIACRRCPEQFPDLCACARRSFLKEVSADRIVDYLTETKQTSQLRVLQDIIRHGTYFYRFDCFNTICACCEGEISKCGITHMEWNLCLSCVQYFAETRPVTSDQILRAMPCTPVAIAAPKLESEAKDSKASQGETRHVIPLELFNENFVPTHTQTNA